MRYSPGSEATLEATFTNSYGQPMDPETIYVDIFDSNGVKVLDNGNPERLSLGTYRYAYSLPADADLGLWRIEWQAIVDGLNAFGEEVFEVEFSGVVVLPSESVQHARLRSRLGEVSRLPEEEAGSDTMFSTSDIADLISYAEGDLDYATYEGWRRKAAHLSRLIDISESGSDRQLSQRYRQAKSMLDFWGGALAATGSAHAEAMAGRVVGRVINWGKIEDPNPGTPFNDYGENVRAYPTHRLLIPAILS